jgi:transposase-like protein
MIDWRKKKRKHYALEFKKLVNRTILAEGLLQASIKHGISPQTISKWPSQIQNWEPDNKNLPTIRKMENRFIEVQLPLPREKPVENQKCEIELKNSRGHTMKISMLQGGAVEMKNIIGTFLGA